MRYLIIFYCVFLCSCSSAQQKVNFDIKGIAFEADGTLAEREALKNSYNNLVDNIANAGWVEKKEALMEEMHQPGFWEQDNRFKKLSAVEFLDRFEAGLETADSLLDRSNQRRFGIDAAVSGCLGQAWRCS